MKIKSVHGDRIIVRPVRTPLKYGAIYLPTSTVKNTQVAKVLHVGPEVKNLKPNEVVVFNNLAGVIIDKKDNLLLLTYEDILAVMEE